MNKIDLQKYAAETNTTLTTDLEPAISIDFTSRIVSNIKELQEVLGVSELVPMSAGTDIKIYKMTKTNTPSQVREGEDIPLTKIERKLANTISLTLNKYRKNTTAEAIQKVGRDMAINKTDEKMTFEIQKDIKKSFYDTLKTGSGSASGTNLQTALAALWAKLQEYYEDMDIDPIYFVNPTDVSDYLGTSQITMQNAFGFTYIENFLGLGTAMITPKAEKLKPIATAKQNLNGAYVPMSGDLGQTFNLTSDETGLVGMTHQNVLKNASVDTLLLSSVKFYPEFIDGVFKATITPVSE